MNALRLRHGSILWCRNPYKESPAWWPAVCVDPSAMPELIRRQQTADALCVMIFGPSIFETECQRDFAWLSKADVVPFTEYFDRLRVRGPPSAVAVVRASCSHWDVGCMQVLFLIAHLSRHRCWSPRAASAPPRPTFCSLIGP